MIYRIVPQTGRSGIFVEPRSGCVIRYVTRKEMSEQYRDKNFNVIGEIGGFARAPAQGDILITENGSNIPILPRGSRVRPLEWIVGYIAVEKSSYLAVVKSLRCSLICRRKNSRSTAWKKKR
jgi:hypothetical protein